MKYVFEADITVEGIARKAGEVVDESEIPAGSMPCLLRGFIKVATDAVPADVATETPPVTAIEPTGTEQAEPPADAAEAEQPTEAVPADVATETKPTNKTKKKDS